MRNIPTQSGSLSSEKRKLLELRLKQKGISIPETQVIPKRKTLGPCPLSFAQQRLWFLDQLELGSTAYLIPHALRFQGDLSIETLERSLEELVRRHESLRTTFPMQASQPVQVIHPAGDWILPMIDLQGLGQEHREETARWLAKQEAQHPCDLAKGPLLRMYLLQLETQAYVVLLTLHHIITDGWSNEILVRELTTLYRAFVAGQPSLLAPLPIQYADYALWQREWLQGEVLEAQLAYWQKQLSGVLPLALPTDHPRPLVQRYQGTIQTWLLPTALSEGLLALSRQQDMTLFMTLLATFQVLLMRYTGQSDICVGTPIANRRQAELEAVIGFFVNTLVVRMDLSGNPTCVQVLQRVREVCLEAYAHQDIPFEKVVEELEPERDLSRSPLFQVMLVLQNVPREQADLAGVSIRPLAVEGTTSKFDLSLSVAETGQGLHCSLEYRTDLFEAETITRMLGYWQTLLEGMVHHPQARIAEVPLLTEAERQLLLVEWNTTQRDYPEGVCVHQHFEQQVERTPDSVAVVFEDEALTYAELNRRANQLAHHLRGLGIGPERLVGICIERSLEMIVGLLGILKAGGAYVPLDPIYPQEHLAFILTDTQVLAVLTMQHLVDRFPYAAQVIALDREWPRIVRECSNNIEQHLVATIGAYVIYTSGSTGTPKGTIITHQGLINYLYWSSQYYEVAASRGAVVHSSIAFDLTVTSLFAPLIVGSQVVLVGGLYGREELGQTLRQWGDFSLVKITPAHLEWLTASLHGNELANARCLVIGGEALSGASLTPWCTHAPKTRLINEYGPTETVVGCCIYEVSGEETVSGNIPIGRPIANTQLYVLDAYMQPVPIGVTGELYIGGSGLARGYLNRPDLTATCFIANPFSTEPGQRLYKTGDLARYRADGAIEFLGRIDYQVKLRGYRIELGEVETVLAQYPGVRESVVVVHEDQTKNKRLVAYVVTHDKEGYANKELKQYLQDRLPAYMIPSAFVTLDTLPLTPNGKVDRRALPAPEEVQDAEYEALEDARTPIEELLVGLWSEVLRRTQVGIHEHFFELGGHSLLATQLIARVRATLRVEVPLRAVFEAPTVAGLAQRVEQALRKGEGMEGPPLVARERPDEIPLSFAQQRLWFLDQLQPGCTAYLVPHAHHLRGPLNTVALERSLEEMVQRHETLRTTFAADAGQPMQVIHPTGHYCLPLVDLRGLGQEKRKREAQKLAKQEGQHPCDLERGPLLRTSLLHLDGEEHILLLTLHHIVTDGWSDRVLMRELVTLYRAFVAGRPSPLASLPIQYADYALWQRQWLQGEVLETQLDYWTQRLGGVPPIELPADYPRPSVASPRGATHSFALSVDLSQALGALSRQEGMTLFMTLLAAFQVLFYRSTGQSDIVIGTDSANRNRVETEGIIGFFINVLPLRADLSGRPSFREVLKQVREIVLGAYTHQDTPFELLVEKLAPDHYLDRTPLVQVLFVLQNIPVELADAGPRREPKALDQSSLRPLMGEERMVKFDLALFMQERAGRLSGALNYRLDVFKASTIATMTARFETLLQSIVKQPDTPIDLLEMTSDIDRAQQDREEQELRHELRIGNDGWFDLSEMDFAKRSSSE